MCFYVKFFGWLFWLLPSLMQKVNKLLNKGVRSIRPNANIFIQNYLADMWRSLTLIMTICPIKKWKLSPSCLQPRGWINKEKGEENIIKIVQIDPFFTAQTGSVPTVIPESEWRIGLCRELNPIHSKLGNSFSRRFQFLMMAGSTPLVSVVSAIMVTLVTCEQQHFFHI